MKGLHDFLGSAGMLGYLNQHGWREHQFKIGIKVDNEEIDVPTHKIDNFKGAVGVEVEWNNKKEFMTAI